MRLSPLWLFLGAVALTGCRPESSTRSTPASTPVAVHLGTARAAALPAVLELPATVRPADRAVISAKVSGTIVTLAWGLGQEVRQGDLLVVLAIPEAEARVRQAQAQLAEATRSADRQRTLVEKGVNPADSLRDAEDRQRFAEAQLAEAEAILAHGSIRAPFTGVVTEKQALPGDLASPGVPLLTLESTAHLRAEGMIPENAAAALHLGDRLAVLPEGADQAIDGVVEELAGAADPASRSVLAKVSVPAGRARSGQFARLLVPAGSTDAILVPQSAVTRFGQMERVFVARDGRAELRLVKTGRAHGDEIAVQSGITTGERVVLNPPAALREGDVLQSAP